MNLTNILAGTEPPLRQVGVDDSVYLQVQTDGRVITWTKHGGSWAITSAGGGAGPTAFTSLTDVPSSYSGQSGKVASVKGDESGLEFTTPSSGGSFLSANTARVDPGGNDGTGTVGDLSKPFLTVQAAVDDIAVNNTGGGTSGGVIILPATNLSENLTLSIPDSGTTIISFKGQRGGPSYGYIAFNLLTITAATPDTGVVEIFLDDVVIGTGGVTTDVETLFLFLHDVDFNGGTITLSEGVVTATIGGFGNTSGNIGYINVAANLEQPTQVTLFGIYAGSSHTEVTMTDGRIDIIDCKPRPDEWQSYAGISVDDGTETGDGGTVNARNSILGDVTAGFITCVDSRIVGSVTTTADPPVDYQDVFLKGVPPGGTTGQALEKASNDDFDTSWESLV